MRHVLYKSCQKTGGELAKDKPIPMYTLAVALFQVLTTGSPLQHLTVIFQIRDVIRDIHNECAEGTTTPLMPLLVFSDVLGILNNEQNLADVLSSLHTEP